MIICLNVLGMEVVVVVGNGVWVIVVFEVEVEVGVVVNGELGWVVVVLWGEWEGDGDWEFVVFGEGFDFGLSGSFLGEFGDGNGEEVVVEGGGVLVVGVVVVLVGVNVFIGMEEKVVFVIVGVGSLMFKRGLMWGFVLGLVVFFQMIGDVLRWVFFFVRFGML